MSLCPKGHDRAAQPLASNRGCRVCQRARQRRYRSTPKGKRLNLANSKGEKAKARKRSYWRTKRVLDPAWAEKDRAKSLNYYRAHATERKAYNRAFAARAKQMFPAVTDGHAAAAIFRQMRKGVAA